MSMKNASDAERRQEVLFRPGDLDRRDDFCGSGHVSVYTFLETDGGAAAGEDDGRLDGRMPPAPRQSLLSLSGTSSGGNRFIFRHAFGCSGAEDGQVRFAADGGTGMSGGAGGSGGGGGGRVEAPARDLADLAPGEGRIVEMNKEKIGVYRDDQGNLHAVSTVCTHRGCTVGWNSAEKTWDCPCHGSRYDPLGRVIHGPAIVNLARKKVP
jgi:nitrite reductase/ring-hydroxylating ferredoxin subunit